MQTFRQTLQSIRRAQTVRELLAAIPQHAVGTAAMVLLCYLCLLSPLASLTYAGEDLYVFSGNALSFLMSDTFPYADHWYRMMATVIILSLLFVAYAAGKLYYRLRDAHQPLAAWLRGHKAVLFFGLLFLWAVVSFALSSHHFRSFFGTGYRHDGLLTYLFYIGLFCMTLQLDRRQMRAVLECFAAAGALLGLLCVVPGSAFARLFYMREAGFKLSIFLQRTHFGYYLSLCVPAALTLFLTDTYAARKPLRLLQQAARTAECWLLLNAVVFNATRATIVALGCAAVAAHAYLLGFRRQRAGRLLALDALLAATVLFLNTGNNLFLRTQQSAAYAQQVRAAASGAASAQDTQLDGALDALTSSRYSMWAGGLRYALQKPLFGWGPDNLGELYYADGMTYTDRPHNEFIQIAASLGFPALGLYLAGLGSLAKAVWQKARTLDPFTAGLVVTAVSYLVCSVFSNSMFYTTPYFYMVVGMGYKLVEG